MTRKIPVLRIIGGELRGRRLQAPRGNETRPTSARAREGLFGWLGTRVEGARVLDLFAGTGALGIEALSRGADHVLFIERDTAAVACLRKNLQGLELARRSRVLAADAGRALGRLLGEDGGFDLVLADPPYEEVLPNTVRVVDWARLVGDEGALILERRTRARVDVLTLEGLIRLGSRSYGQTRFDWYARPGQGEESRGDE